MQFFSLSSSLSLLLLLLLLFCSISEAIKINIDLLVEVGQNLSFQSLKHLPPYFHTRKMIESKAIEMLLKDEKQVRQKKKEYTALYDLAGFYHIDATSLEKTIHIPPGIILDNEHLRKNLANLVTLAHKKEIPPVYQIFFIKDEDVFPFILSDRQIVTYCFSKKVDNGNNDEGPSLSTKKSGKSKETNLFEEIKNGMLNPKLWSDKELIPVRRRPNFIYYCEPVYWFLHFRDVKNINPFVSDEIPKRPDESVFNSNDLVRFLGNNVWLMPFLRIAKADTIELIRGAVNRNRDYLPGVQDVELWTQELRKKLPKKQG